MSQATENEKKVDTTLSSSSSKDESVAKKQRQPSLYVCHGGGPMPYLAKLRKTSYDDETNGFILKSLDWLGGYIDKYKPKALLLISAHWEESQLACIYQKSPSLFYDYYGFPKESYKLAYSPKCDLATTDAMVNILNAAIKGKAKELKFLKSEVKYDKSRGWDHGVFIPLILARPNADIPILQLSLLTSLNATDHLELGKVSNFFFFLKKNY
ncbi:hypothetical protein RFI_23844 [Reticulomyxa filosa]|uniref:Extradiol ring-cleavage dioxygenase class III enzyme subunit B domain-containing protein n=1 Tax=Reticulomyxa filosa TaxID=46433 RepID=X6MIN5_RETFI|nr:hypothetical protein RFI_23844 [Reticulomyxa filosa]|eukprot:ETO13521.1 hypothetical protein RFI_23844 [Reticulomyxa filosa]